MAAEKIDIHDLMKSIQQSDKMYFKSLPDDMKKSFAPVVVGRWLSGSSSKRKLLLVNQVLNTVVFKLHTHPDLLYRLMIAASCDNGYSWVPKKYKKTIATESCKIVAEYYMCSTRVASDYLRLMTLDDVLSMADDLGKDKDSLTKIKANFKNK